MGVSIIVTMEGKEPFDLSLPDPNMYFEDMIEQLADLWGVNWQEYVLVSGTDIFEGRVKISDANVQPSALFVMTPRSDALKRTTQIQEAGDLSKALQWLHENPGLDPGNLTVISDDAKEPRTVIFENNKNKHQYQVLVDIQGKVRRYQPLR